ncbi:MAG: hypothetical protein ACI4PG_03980 [Candidatus Ventricola sp.]
MDTLKELFEYQRFAANPRLQRQIDAVYQRVLAAGQALADDELELAAAGEPQPDKGRTPPGKDSRA